MTIGILVITFLASVTSRPSEPGFANTMSGLDALTDEFLGIQIVVTSAYGADEALATARPAWSGVKLAYINRTIVSILAIVKFVKNRELREKS